MRPVILKPQRLEDKRGWFSETWNSQRLRVAGLDIPFCQDNHSYSRSAGTLRGLHFQFPPRAQTKLVRCIKGRIFDVIVDIRRASPTFGQWLGIELSAENGRQLLIPKGYAHGFLTLTPDCEIAYKVDDFYAAGCDSGIAWNDPYIAIKWPIPVAAPYLSEKDRNLPELCELETEFPYDGAPLSPLQEIRI